MKNADDPLQGQLRGPSYHIPSIAYNKPVMFSQKLLRHAVASTLIVYVCTGEEKLESYHDTNEETHAWCCGVNHYR